MKQYRRGDNMHHIDNLYDEIRVIREQLLNRIEMLEDDVDYLMEENKYYSKEIYQLQSDINSLLADITRRRTNEGLEFKEGSKKVNKKSKETP
jgi:peptidoglycan hydrolase CwlO-like protein